MDASAAAPQTESRSGARVGWWIAGILLATTVLAVIVYRIYPAWVVNSDGSGYMSIGYNIRRGLGFSLPDGAATSSLRGPLYPLMLTAGWFGGPSARASIWVSRLPLVLAPGVAAFVVWRLTRSLPAMVAAALAALAQPWMLAAGGSLMVPDGTAAFTTLAAVGFTAVGQAAPRRRGAWYAIAALAALLAMATKETGALAIVLAAAVWVIGRYQPPRIAIVGGTVLLMLGTITALIVTAGYTDRGLTELPGAFFTRFSGELYFHARWWVVTLVLGALLVAWALPRCRQPIVAAGLLLATTGFAIGVYSAGRTFGMRNAALMPYGLALLVGAFVAEYAHRREWAWRVVAIAVAVVLVAAGAGGLDAAGAKTELTAGWNNPAALEASAWLGRHAHGKPVGCTLLYCSYIWLDRRADLDVHLLPLYGARLGPDRFQALDFDEREGWSGRIADHPSSTRHPLMVTRSGQLYGAAFEEPLLAAIKRDHLRYVVVTGSVHSSATFEAGRLLPYFEANPAFRRVLLTNPAYLPQFVAIYEVVGSPRPLPGAKPVLSAPALESLAADPAMKDTPMFQTESYAAMLEQVRASRPRPGP